MDKTRLFEVLASGGNSRPYGMIPSLELAEKFPGAQCVKCTDSLFLVRTEERTFLYDDELGKTLAPQELPETDALNGFSREISMAPDVILLAEFSDGKVRLGEEEFTASVREVSGKMDLVLFEEGDMILADISRFLLYGSAGGEFICGYLEV